jgi:hypothetical protein
MKNSLPFERASIDPSTTDWWAEIFAEEWVVETLGIAVAAVPPFLRVELDPVLGKERAPHDASRTLVAWCIPVEMA